MFELVQWAVKADVLAAVHPIKRLAREIEREVLYGDEQE